MDRTLVNQRLIDAISSQLCAHADPTRAHGQQTYMKSALPFIGVRVPVVRRLTHGACKANPCTDGRQYRATVEALFGTAEYQEQRYAAVGVCTFTGHDRYQTLNQLPMYRELIVEAAWWDIVDELSLRVGLLLQRYPKPMARTLRRWARGENLWLRRTAIIAQRALKQVTDVSLLFDCIEPALDSREFFLRKAIGWALRDLARTNPRAVLAYVETHQERLSPLSKREALKHLASRPE